MTDFEQMARELVPEHTVNDDTCDVEFWVTEAKLLDFARRVADVENEICAQIAATETGDIADAIAARRKNRSAT